MTRDLIPHDVRDRYTLAGSMLGPAVLVGVVALAGYGLIGFSWVLLGLLLATATVTGAALLLRKRGWHRKTDKEVIRAAFPRSTVRWQVLSHGVRVELVPPVPPARLTAELVKLGYRPGSVTTIERRRTTVQVVEAQR